MTETGLFEAEEKSIAKVALDVSFAHLDRLFDYEAIDGVVPGCRVNVRFAGRKTVGFVVEVVTTNQYPAKLARIESIVSAEPVLKPEIYSLARSVADRYGGVISDVLRNAVPPRHARTEKATPPQRGAMLGSSAHEELWADYDAGASVLTQLSWGEPVRAVMSVRPDHDEADLISAAIHEVTSSGRGVIVCVPDVRDINHFDKRFQESLDADSFVVLSSAQSPAKRYESFLAVLRGEVSVVVGTRNAAYAPVNNLGLVVIVDDGDDLYVDQRAPYAHTREVLLTRAMNEQLAVLLVSFARSCEAQRLVDISWAMSIEPHDRKQSWARVDVVENEHNERLPHGAFGVIRKGLETGPVLISVPRRGYRSALACQECRTPARCVHCQGPLVQPRANATPACLWCGHIASDYRCRECRSTHVRAPVIGAERLAEELGKAFVHTTIKRSSGDHIIDYLDQSPAIVIATPGAEPRIDGGYAAAVILDTSLALARPALRVNEEAHRRWFNVIAKVNSAGSVAVVGKPASLQALVRVDPVGFAERELSEREAAHLPPTAHLAVIEGPHDELLAVDVAWPQPREVYGPVVIDEERSRLIVRVPHHLLTELSAAVAHLNAWRSSQKMRPFITRINPYDI